MTHTLVDQLMNPEELKIKKTLLIAFKLIIIIIIIVVVVVVVVVISHQTINKPLKSQSTTFQGYLPLEDFKPHQAPKSPWE